MTELPNATTRDGWDVAKAPLATVSVLKVALATFVPVVQQTEEEASA